jgi:hypothetical protein
LGESAGVFKQGKLYIWRGFLDETGWSAAPVLEFDIEMVECN